MISHNMEQHSEEWWAVRRGIPTASSADKIITSTGKFSTQSKGYAFQLIANEVTQEDEQIEQTDWMERGHRLEEEARDWLSFDLGREVKQVGFMTNDDATMGVSPDGIIEDEMAAVESRPSLCSLLEIKCPKGSTHVGYLISGKLPTTYVAQCHMAMYISGLPLKFVSYHPDFRPFVIDIKPDDFTEKVGEAVHTFVEYLNKIRKEITGDSGKPS